MPNAEKKHKEARCHQHFVTLCPLKHNKHLYNRLGSMSQLRVFGVTNRINKMKNKKYHTTVEREAKSNRTTVEREAKSKLLAKHNT